MWRAVVRRMATSGHSGWPSPRNISDCAATSASASWRRNASGSEGMPRLTHRCDANTDDATSIRRRASSAPRAHPTRNAACARLVATPAGGCPAVGVAGLRTPRRIGRVVALFGIPRTVVRCPQLVCGSTTRRMTTRAMSSSGVVSATRLRMTSRATVSGSPGETASRRRWKPASRFSPRRSMRPSV